MKTIIILLQIIIAFGLINVWILRFSSKTKYRGKQSHNMQEEFKTYGLSKGFMYLIGFLKIIIAIALLAGIWAEVLVAPASGLLAILMIGAIAMHIKVGDAGAKSLPALTMLAMSVLVFFF